MGDYFAAILAQEKEGTPPGQREETLTPLVQKLKGALADSEVTEEDYYKHLEEKYLQR